MGFFDDAATVISSSSKHHKHKSHSSKHDKHHHKSHKSRSRSRSSSRYRGGGIAASIFGGGSEYHKHNSSKSSFFNLGNASSKSFFGFGAAGRSPSYYKRSPRQGFLQRAYKKVKRLLRDLVHYAKRHPLKVFMLVIMPLITGGALTALLARFGLSLPPGLEHMMGLGAKAMSGDGIGLVGEAVKMASGVGLGSGNSGSVSASRGYDGSSGVQWEKRSVDAPSFGGASDLFGAFGGGGGGGWMKDVSKIFS